MRATLSADEVATFRLEGCLLAPALFDAAEVDLLRRAAALEVTAGAAQRKDTEGHVTRLSVRNELGGDVFSAVVRCRRVAASMQELLGDEVYHYHHKLMIKDPEVGGAWEWHQDYGYWYENGCLAPDMASCLVAIGPATRENGCLQVVPRSHALGRLEHRRVSDQAGADPERVRAILERFPARHVEMAPGDALFFHCNLLHRSDRNASRAPRLSLIACYNTRHNDPVREHHHPRYHPLEIRDDACVAAAGRRQLETGDPVERCMRRWKVVGIDFSHMHMGDNLRMAHEAPEVDIVGIADARPAKTAFAVRNFGLPASAVFRDARECLERTRPDLAILCPPTGRRVELVELVAAHGVHVLLEKPFAASLAEADRMTRACARAGVRLAINWPLAWYPPHVTAKRLVDEGAIGDVTTCNYYDGNRGPLFHVEDKLGTSAEFRSSEKARSWFYQRAEGGGSLLDYLGYGATLGTWFLGGRAPLEVTTVVDQPAGLEVDEHSLTIARYEFGISRFETRWGTFSDPWVHQPQPKCGFEIVGRAGTLTSYDYEDVVRVQTRAQPEVHELPVDALEPPRQSPVQYVVHCLATDAPIEGPLSPELARVGQRIVDGAVRSAREKRGVPLPD